MGNDKIFKNKGFGLIGAMVGILISAVLLTAFMNLLNQAMKISRANASELKAKMYLQEMIEAAKDLERSNWDELTTTTSPCASQNICHLKASSTSLVYDVWKAFSNEEYVDNNYKRWIIIEDVLRDNVNNNIVESGGIPDDYTKKVIATIEWDNGNQTSTLETFIYNYSGI